MTFVREPPDFGLNLGYLQTGHGSLNVFLYENALTTMMLGRGIVRSGEEWDFSHVLADDRTVGVKLAFNWRRLHEDFAGPTEVSVTVWITVQLGQCGRCAR